MVKLRGLLTVRLRANFCGTYSPTSNSSIHRSTHLTSHAIHSPHLKHYTLACAVRHTSKAMLLDYIQNNSTPISSNSDDDDSISSSKKKKKRKAKKGKGRLRYKGCGCGKCLWQLMSTAAGAKNKLARVRAFARARLCSSFNCATNSTRLQYCKAMHAILLHDPRIAGTL